MHVRALWLALALVLMAGTWAPIIEKAGAYAD
jgi:hypothetical protein